jgi:hypothetical protein
MECVLWQCWTVLVYRGRLCDEENHSGGLLVVKFGSIVWNVNGSLPIVPSHHDHPIHQKGGNIISSTAPALNRNLQDAPVPQCSSRWMEALTRCMNSKLAVVCRTLQLVTQR